MLANSPLASAQGSCLGKHRGTMSPWLRTHVQTAETRSRRQHLQTKNHSKVEIRIHTCCMLGSTQS